MRSTFAREEQARRVIVGISNLVVDVDVGVGVGDEGKKEELLIVFHQEGQPWGVEGGSKRVAGRG